MSRLDPAETLDKAVGLYYNEAQENTFRNQYYVVKENLL